MNGHAIETLQKSILCVTALVNNTVLSPQQPFTPSPLALLSLRARAAVEVISVNVVVVLLMVKRVVVTVAVHGGLLHSFVFGRLPEKGKGDAGAAGSYMRNVHLPEVPHQKGVDNGVNKGVAVAQPHEGAEDLGRNAATLRVDDVRDEERRPRDDVRPDDNAEGDGGLAGEGFPDAGVGQLLAQQHSGGSNERTYEQGLALGLRRHATVEDESDDYGKEDGDERGGQRVGKADAQHALRHLAVGRQVMQGVVVRVVPPVGDRDEGGGHGDGPGQQQQQPGTPRGHEGVVAKRRHDGQVAVEADEADVEN